RCVQWARGRRRRWRQGRRRRSRRKRRARGKRGRRRRRRQRRRRRRDPRFGRRERGVSKRRPRCDPLRERAGRRRKRRRRGRGGREWLRRQRRAQRPRWKRWRRRERPALGPARQERRRWSRRQERRLGLRIRSRRDRRPLRLGWASAEDTMVRESMTTSRPISPSPVRGSYPPDSISSAQVAVSDFARSAMTVCAVMLVATAGGWAAVKASDVHRMGQEGDVASLADAWKKADGDEVRIAVLEELARHAKDDRGKEIVLRQADTDAPEPLKLAAVRAASA